MSTGIEQVADHKQRGMALDIRRSVCVQAPAGSGKTGLLTQRILKLLAVSEQPENILAITFTRKAAAEMKDRLMSLLRKAHGFDKYGSDINVADMNAYDRFNHELATRVLARDQEKQWQLLQNPSRLQIMTIDSFNSYLSTRLSLLSGFGAQPSIKEPADSLYEQAVLDLFRKLESNDRVTDSLSQMLLHFGNNLNQVQELLTVMIAKRDQWLRHVVSFRLNPDHQAIRAYIETNIRHLIEERLENVGRILEPWLPELMEFLHYSKANLQIDDNAGHPLFSLILPTGTPRAVCEQLGVWKALAGMLLTNQGTLRKTTDKRNGFPTSNDTLDRKTASSMKSSFMALLENLAEQQGLVEELEELPHLPESDFENEQWQVLTAITDVLFHLSGLLDLVFQKQSQCDYTQVSLAALQSLGSEENPTSTALLMDYRIQHILVDEFQDTSHLQIELLEKLTRGWQPDDGHTLFIVGDPMQSCYGFRNAVVGLFLTTRDQGLGSLVLDDVRLSTNFRSDAAVIHWINGTFSRSFPAQDEPSRGAVSYTPADIINPDSEGAGIHCHLFQPEPDVEFDKYTLACREARHVVSVIQSLNQKKPNESIALLVKNRTHLKQILPVLKQSGIRWNATDLDPLNTWQDIQDLLTLCRALLNPADRTAWLALLRTPFIGLDMQDLLLICLEADEQHSSLCNHLLTAELPTSLSANATTILGRVIPVLIHARNNRLRMSLRDWLEQTWISLGGPVCLHDSLEPAHLDTFFSLLEEESENADITDIKHFEKRLANTRIDSHGGHDAQLEIMTIHKAKGLEFDHVLLPCLNDGGRSDQGQILQWQETLDHLGDTSLMLSVPAAKGTDTNSLHAFISRESKARTQLEQARLLYIGVTRAKKSAWLSASLKRDRNGNPDCSKNTLLSHIWNALQPLEANTLLENVGIPEPSDSDTAVNSDAIITRRIPVDWISPGSISTEDDTTDETADPFVSNKAERCRGDIVHEYLQLMAQGRLAPEISTMGKVWRRRLESCTDDPEPHVQEIYRQLQQISTSSISAWILSADHEQAACEMPVSDYCQHNRKEYIIDRIFVENNIRWIIDYKTASPADNQSDEEFLAAEKARYEPQLKKYAELILEIHPETRIKTALYFTALDKLTEISCSQHGNQEAQPL